MSYTREEAERINELTRVKSEPKEDGSRDPEYAGLGSVARWRERALAAEAKLRDIEKARERLVVIESPFAGDVAGNVAYAKALLLDSLRRGECPTASHLLYPQVLDDMKPEERKLGIEAGLAWARFAKYSIVGVERGISDGMKIGMGRAVQEGRIVVERRILDGEQKKK